METKATGSTKRQTAQEDSRDSVQKTRGSATTELCIHKAKPSAEGMDKLFPNRKYEDMAKGRTGPMAAPQSASSDTQAMEEAEDDLQESNEAPSLPEEQHSARKNIGSRQCQARMVQEGKTTNCQFSDNPCDSFHA